MPKNTYENTEPNYQLNCGQYVLHRGSTPVGRPLDEVAIAFDRDEGVLHKHGSPEFVNNWAEETRAKLRAAGSNLEDWATALTVVSGRIPVDELNSCLSSSGYVLQLWAKLTRGELARQPEG